VIQTIGYRLKERMARDYTKIEGIRSQFTVCS